MVFKQNYIQILKVSICYVKFLGLTNYTDLKVSKHNTILILLCKCIVTFTDNKLHKCSIYTLAAGCLCAAGLVACACVCVCACAGAGGAAGSLARGNNCAMSASGSRIIAAISCAACFVASDDPLLNLFTD